MYRTSPSFVVASAAGLADGPMAAGHMELSSKLCVLVLVLMLAMTNLSMMSVVVANVAGVAMVIVGTQ